MGSGCSVAKVDRCWSRSVSFTFRVGGDARQSSYFGKKLDLVSCLFQIQIVFFPQFLEAIFHLNFELLEVPTLRSVKTNEFVIFFEDFF